MADDHAPLHHTLFIENGVADLPHHLRQGRLRHLRVIRRAGIGLRRFRFHIFKIGQIDIHDALQKLQGLHLLIAAAIIYDRKRKSPEPRLLHSLHNLRRVMGGRHQINVGRAFFLQLQKNLGQTFQRNLHARLRRRDIPVLAVDAPQRTAREKDGPRAATSRDAGLLPHVKGRPGAADGPSRHAAEAFFAACPVRATLPRT